MTVTRQEGRISSVVEAVVGGDVEGAGEEGGAVEGGVAIGDNLLSVDSLCDRKKSCIDMLCTADHYLRVAMQRLKLHRKIKSHLSIKCKRDKMLSRDFSLCPVS